MDHLPTNVYFASGTGNSRRVAVWMCRAQESRGIPARAIPIDHARPDVEIGSSRDSWMGLSFPTHGFMPPWSMIKFLCKLPRRKGVKAMAVATRGCLKFGAFYLPGAAGLAPWMAWLILWFKGYSVKGLLGLDMPANMLNLHPGLHPDNVSAIIQRAQVRFDSWQSRVFSRRFTWPILNCLWESAWGGALLYFWPLFPPLYLLIGRLFMAKLMYASTACTGCGSCARTCPNQAIRMIGETDPRPYWTQACEVCIRCMAYCPRKAVQASHPWAMGLTWLAMLPSAAAIQRQLGAWLGCAPVLSGSSLYLLDNLLAYPVIIALYVPFWWLMRVAVINGVLSRLTLTRYYRRYHEPETGLPDLSQSPDSTTTNRISSPDATAT